MPFWGTNRFNGCKYWSPFASLPLAQHRKRYLTRSRPFITIDCHYMPLASPGQPAARPSRPVEIAPRPRKASGPEIELRAQWNFLVKFDPKLARQRDGKAPGTGEHGRLVPQGYRGCDALEIRSGVPTLSPALNCSLSVQTRSGGRRDRHCFIWPILK